MSASPTKSDRVAAIEQCATMIGEFYGIDPCKMWSASTKSSIVREARELLIAYLHQQGMSILAISRLFIRSEDYCRRAQIQGKQHHLPTYKPLVDVLPPIPSSLEITRI